MKIRVSTLRRIIREVGLSPAVFKQEPVQDPMDLPNIAKAITTLEAPLKTAIKRNLVLAAKDQYDEATRELDDAAWERINTVADKATEMVIARVHKAIQSSWAEAMKGAGTAEKPAAKPAAKAVA